MIYEGTDGSINGFYKGKLVVSRPLGNGRTIEEYKREMERIVIQSMRDGIHISKIKKLAVEAMNLCRYNEKIKEPTIEDKDFIMLTLLLLIKFGVVEEDGAGEGLLIMGRKKPKKFD